MLRSCRDEIARFRQHNEQLRAQIDVIEYNVSCLGTDPEELYRPWPKPVRSMSFAGRRKKQA